LPARTHGGRRISTTLSLVNPVFASKQVPSQRRLRAKHLRKRNGRHDERRASAQLWARYRLTLQPWLAFLGHGRDSAVFQDQTVLEIVQSVFTDYQSSYQGQSKLAPAWRLDILDASVQAKEHVLLTAGGAYIKMSGGNIEVHAPGMVDFKASMKSWTGPMSDSVAPINLPGGQPLPNKRVNSLYWSYGPEFEQLTSMSKHAVDINLHAKTTGYASGESVTVEIEFEDPKQDEGSSKTVQLTGIVNQKSEVVIRDVFKSRQINIGWRV
jgi:Phage tail baseplate hub (GPD)/Uncharacterized protein conserved in bacteria (DUF2345)